MPDSVPSDHDSVTTFRTHLERSGGTRRPVLRLPDDAAVEDGDLVRVVLDRERYHGRVASDTAGRFLRGVYDDRALAKSPGEGENRLAAWFAEHDLETDDAVEFDEVVAGDLYGVRVPGERAVYEVSHSPRSSLQDIADGLDG